MRLNFVSDLLVKTDNVLDHVPIASSVTNFVDIFQKCVVLPFITNPSVSNNHYYTHLKDKSFARCLILLVPFFGNIAVGIYDFATRKNKNELTIAQFESCLKEIEGNEFENNEFESNEFKGNKDDLVIVNGEEVQVKTIEETIEEKNIRVTAEKEKIEHEAAQELKRQQDVIENIKQSDDRKFIIEALDENPTLFPFIKDKFKKDEDLVLKYINKNLLIFCCIPNDLQLNTAFQMKAVNENIETLQLIMNKWPPIVQSDPDYEEVISARVDFLARIALKKPRAFLMVPSELRKAVSQKKQQLKEEEDKKGRQAMAHLAYRNSHYS